MKALKKRNIMPRIIVSSAKIHCPPGIIKTGAEAVVARLETLEKQPTEMMKMHQISQKLQTTSATQSTLSTMAPTRMMRPPTMVPLLGVRLSGKRENQPHKETAK